jgi:hypothetical protein
MSDFETLPVWRSILRMFEVRASFDFPDSAFATQ